MRSIVTLTCSLAKGLLAGEGGIAAIAESLDPGLVAPSLFIGTGNMPIELVERSPVSYPSVHIYCEKLSNNLREKFRTYSGKVNLIIEVRASSDHAAATENSLQLYTQSALEVLNASRGDWGSGVFFGGAYEVTFSPIRRGGVNLLQTARISLPLDLCID